MTQTLKHSISTILLGSAFAATLVFGSGKITALGAENEQAILSLTAKDENKVEQNTEAIYEEISYQILDAQITREIGEHEKENVYYFAEETDEAGNLTGTQQYLWITMKIKNLANT